MNKSLARTLFWLSSGLALLPILSLTGCASGGYKLTRQYAGWINGQNIILRIVLYILTNIVFGVTLLIDLVLFNTLDFWQGKISANTFDFKDGDKTYHVQHEVAPETQLKRSRILVYDSKQELIQEIVLHETSMGEIEMIIDGKLRSRVEHISSIPVISRFDSFGFLREQKPFLGIELQLADPSLAQK